MVFPIRKSLKSKLVFPALAIIILGMGSFAAIAYNRARLAFNEIIIQEINQVADTTITGISTWIKDRGIDIHDWSQQRLYKTALMPTFLGNTARTYASRQLKKIQSDYGYYENIVVSTMAGEAMAYAEPPPPMPPSDPDSPENSHHVHGQGRARISSQVFKSPVTGKFVFTIAAPVASDGKEIGHLTGVIKAGVIIDRFISPIQIGEKGYAFVFKDTGEVIAEPETIERLGVRNLFELPFGSQIIGGKGIVEYSLKGRHMTAVVKRLEHMRLTIVVCAQTSEILTPIRELRNLYLTISLVVVVLVALALLFISGTLIRPIQELVVGLEKMGRGNLAHRINVSTQDEIGSIGHAMNHMAMKLEASNRRINSQNKMLVQARDQLEQKVEERTRELRLAEENYRSIYENAIEGIFRVNREGTFTHANPAMLRIMGLERTEDLSRESIEGIFADPGTLASFKRAFNQRGDVIGFEAEIRRQDQSACWCSISIQTIKNARGDTAYFEGSVFDISERIEREKAEREKEAAIAASRVKSEFLANMSHEIRTPLNAIIGFCGLLSDGIRDRKQQNYIQSILTAANALLLLINDILDLSKMEAGKISISPSRVSIPALVDEIGRLFEPQFLEKSLDFRVEIAPPFTRCIVIDEARLRQILVNLVGNAIKFTHEGYVRLQVEHSPGDETCDLSISVEDTGIGIPKSHMERVFESFEQIDSSVRKKYGGTGLGLPICKRLVTAMGGEIGVISSVKKGTRFTVAFKGLKMEAADNYQRPSQALSHAGEHRILPLAGEKIPEEFKHALLEDLYPRSLLFHEAVVVNEVLAWALEVKALAGRHAISSVVTFCDEVIFHAETFDIEMIQKKMSDFSLMVSQMT